MFSLIADNGSCGLQCIGISNTPRTNSCNTSSQQYLTVSRSSSNGLNQATKKLHVPDHNLMNPSPAPSDISSIRMTPRLQPTPTNLSIGSLDRKNGADVFLTPGVVPIRKSWDQKFKPLPNVQVSSADSSNSLSPSYNMDSVSLGSFSSPSPSAKTKKRPHSTSISPLSADLLSELYNIIRTSPTSLVAYITNDRSSASGTSSPQYPPQCFTHGSVRRAGSGTPRSGSVTSSNAFTTAGQPVFTKKESFDGTIQSSVALLERCGAAPDYMPLDESNQMVTHYSDHMRYSPPFTMYKTETTMDAYQSTTYNDHSPGMAHGPTPADLPPVSHNGALPVNDENLHPPPPYPQNNNMVQPLLEESSPSVAGDSPKLEQCDEGNNRKEHNCRWIDCNQTFSEKCELVRHIEKQHIDQRKGDDFTCFWAGCTRRYKPFNARYKLLIHMRVHSGEKPNKCTVSLHVSS